MSDNHGGTNGTSRRSLLKKSGGALLGAAGVGVLGVGGAAAQLSHTGYVTSIDGNGHYYIEATGDIQCDNTDGTCVEGPSNNYITGDLYDWETTNFSYNGQVNYIRLWENHIFVGTNSYSGPGYYDGRVYKYDNFSNTNKEYVLRDEDLILPRDNSTEHDDNINDDQVNGLINAGYDKFTHSGLLEEFRAYPESQDVLVWDAPNV